MGMKVDWAIQLGKLHHEQMVLHCTGYDEDGVLVDEEELEHAVGFGCVGHLWKKKRKENKDSSWV